ncbi:cytochrome P460 family protein [Paucidesulfovibrio longus]|uniref:cytochrome P460 family protein n=1 Tax=Paucidesulfovibrio longus TaxID=889 RepID=UPI0003B77B99|nr:cytochrome P460 family protein [Paucidesulfovibrio longus]
MRRQTRMQGLALAALVLLAAAGLSFAAPDGPPPDAANLWNHITTQSPYTQWKNWPDHQGMQPGSSPHGALHVVYVNDAALSVRQPPVPYGSIVVKENYDEAKTLKAITVMYKVKGFNPEAGDWFWAKFAPDGTVQASGTPGGCIGCHSAVAGNDYIFLHAF